MGEKYDNKVIFSWQIILSALHFLLAISSFFASAQQKSLKFTHYSKQDGLNQSSVNYIYQDSKDYLWIANFGGINKFDGYSFTPYINKFGDHSTISDNSVWTILERKDTSLWFGTKRGLSQYNTIEDNFTNYYIRGSDASSGNLAIKTLFEDKKGRFYIGSEGAGLFLFSAEEKTFTPISQIPSNAKISAVTEDATGNLWVGTENLGLFGLNPDRTAVTNFLETQVFMSKTIWSLYADKKGTIWIGTDQDGLVKYQTNDNSFLFYKENQDRFTYQAGDKIKFITQSEGFIWVASATEGLSYYSDKEKRFYNYKKNPYDANTLFDNDVSGVFSGTNNVLYVGFYTKGFDKVIPTPFHTIKNNPKISNTLSNDNVYCMYLDSDDILWLGTYGGGLNSYNFLTKKFRHFRYDKRDPYSISHDWVRIIYEDSKGMMWIGTWGGGLNKFDRKKGTFKRYLPKSGQTNSLNHNIITALFEDKDGELWIGTYGGGINIYQPDTDDFRSITHEPDNKYSLSDDHITSFYEDKNGLLWICTYGGGMNSYDKNREVFERFLPDEKREYSLNNHKTLHIFDKPDTNFFWITTLGGGINKFYPQEKKFLNYTEKDGLSNNSTMGMLPDHTNNYWISSNNGLSYFDVDKESFTNFTMADGLGSDDYNLEAYAKTKNGILYFGGKNGVTYFDPKDVVVEAPFPTVAITKVTVEDSIYMNLSAKLEVPYKNRISFEYAAINPDKTEGIQYAYQLIGQDDQWRDMKRNRYLEFANLTSGTYQLKIKSTNSHQQWNTKYATISFYVPTPWYLSWYFRGILIFITLLGAYSYYWIKMHRIRVRNRVLEEKVEERTKIIKEKNIDLSVAKEKTEVAYEQLKKLENFKNEFTSMLAHDLKNPLVTILGYSSEENSETDLKSINLSGKKMLTLIENMLEVQKFENTDVQLDLKSNSLKSITKEAIRQIKIIADEKRIQIINKIEAKYIVNVDLQTIERVFVNLLSNAIKFSDTDSSIEVFADIDKDNKDLIVISIVDHGEGIPEDRLSLIFKKFSQVEARDLGGTRSTGLGLTFCKMAVEAHGGSIWATSSVDHGSKFFFKIPKLEDSLIANQEDKSSEENYKNPMYSIKLYADDLAILYPLKEKISVLSIYETGGWLTIFEELKKVETENIKDWKQIMMQVLTSFDDKAFLYLRQIAINEIATSN